MLKMIMTVSFTDENGRDRGGRFWVAVDDMEHETKRFKDAGYKVTIHSVPNE